jgi:hypothetical protein
MPKRLGGAPRVKTFPRAGGRVVARTNTGEPADAGHHAAAVAGPTAHGARREDDADATGTHFTLEAPSAE